MALLQQKHSPWCRKIWGYLLWDLRQVTNHHWALILIRRWLQSDSSHLREVSTQSYASVDGTTGWGENWKETRTTTGLPRGGSGPLPIPLRWSLAFHAQRGTSWTLPLLSPLLPAVGLITMWHTWCSMPTLSLSSILPFCLSISLR